MKSSKKLGRGDESKRERLGRVLKEQRAGIADEDADDVLLEERRLPESEEPAIELVTDKSTPAAQSEITPSPVSTSTGTTAFGGGLKRPLDLDEAGQPLIKKRQRTKAVAKPSRVQDKQIPVEDEWEGFSSEDEDGGVDVGSEEDVDSLDSDESPSSDMEGSSSVGVDSGDDSHSESGTEDSDDDEEMEDDAEMKEHKDTMKQRASAFKAWATQGRNEALGFTPSVNIDFFAERVKDGHANADDQVDIRREPTSQAVHDLSKDFLLGTIAISEDDMAARAKHNVSVTRDPDVQEARSALPVVAEEQKIMEAIYNNDCIIIWGATGSGKTTQVPQFLFEAGYGNPDGSTPGIIGVTQPRRVAAVSMAKRVATELGEHGDKVAHQIRFDSNVSSKTAIKFMTDGVLLREVSQDFMLSKYSAIVLDEAHERSVNTDLLIGMLCRIVEMRAEQSKKSKAKHKSLKLIIMSATLRTADLTQNKNLFRISPPPIVQAEGRQYSVTTHFARRTECDYLEEAFKKVSRGHKKLPPGGMLVFLTGQNEINSLAKRLKASFEATEPSTKSYSNVRISAVDAPVEDEDGELGGGESAARYDDDNDEDSDDEIHGVDNDEEFNIGEDPHEMLKIHVLPLYSQLPTEQQMRVFQTPPEGSRLIVLATNVAETSLTIPGIRYVFDCGRAKERQYDLNTGVQTFEVGWISKASASQRAGRAGRTGPGHCYRLYSSAVYERDFAEFAEPEITRTPIEGVVLQLKTMGIPKVTAFPFPAPPDRESLVKAEKLLEYLGALSPEGKVTPSGKQLSLYPLSPRLSRMLCLAQHHGVVAHVVALVSALAVRDLLVSNSQLDLDQPKPLTENDAWTETDNRAAAEFEARRKAYNSFHGHISRLDRHCDALKLLTLLVDYSRGGSPGTDDFHRFARIKSITEALQLRSQLTAIVAANNPGSISSGASLSDPSKSQTSLLRQIIAAGYIDQVAIRADLSPTPPSGNRKPKRVIDVPYITLFPSAFPTSDADADMADAAATKQYVYIHPSSLLTHTSMPTLPQYLIYSHLSRSAPSSIADTKAAKVRMHPLTPVSAAQLIALTQGTPLLEEGKAVGRIDVLPRDEKGRERRSCMTVPFLKGEAGLVGWPLGSARAGIQVRVPGRGWVAEGE